MSRPTWCQVVCMMGDRDISEEGKQRHICSSRACMHAMAVWALKTMTDMADSAL